MANVIYSACGHKTLEFQRIEVRQLSETDADYIELWVCKVCNGTTWILSEGLNE